MQEFKMRFCDSDIIGVVETHASDVINDADISLDGFNMYRLDRKGKAGGGLALYINRKWKSCLCHELMNSDFSESLWCTISTGYGQLLVGLCYRSPSSDANNNMNLLNLLELAAKYQHCTNVMIMGDFNYPSIDFCSHSVSSGLASDAFQFFDKCQELCLFQHVYEPTQFRDGQLPSCLDYVFTDEDNLVHDLQYRTPVGKSDHVVLTWNITVHAEELKCCFKKYNY